MAEKSRGPQHKARSKLSKSPRERTTVNEKLKDFEEGETAKIKVNPQIQDGRPHMRFHGKTGKITGKQGQAYELTVKDGSNNKKVYLKPVHLQKVEN